MPVQPSPHTGPQPRQGQAWHNTGAPPPAALRRASKVARWETDAWFAQLEERWYRQKDSGIPWLSLCVAVITVVVYPVLLMAPAVIGCCTRAAHVFNCVVMDNVTLWPACKCSRAWLRGLGKSATGAALMALRLAVWAAACCPVWLAVAMLFPAACEQAYDALVTSVDVWMSFALALAAMVLSTTVK